jgi:sulfite reductase (NADPH) flavoprotein alpha-component
LDLFGRPSKKFYQQLAELAKNKVRPSVKYFCTHTHSQAEKDKLLWIIGAEGKDDFKQRVDETTTYADLLREFTSAKPTVEQLIELIPPIKPR